MKSLIIEISESVYNQLMTGKRVRGTVGLTDIDMADFHPHAEGRRKVGETSATQKLPHGRVTVTRDHLRLSLSVNRRKEATPVSEMVIDTLQAKEFANEVIYGVSAWPYGVNF